MKISLNWIKEYVQIPWTIETLSEKLASLGFPIESIEKKGVTISGVVSVKILGIDKHPNADRLRIAKVTDGNNEMSIVCGAPNIEVGQVVPLATTGTKLPGGIEIALTKIRGVESCGMLCSERELGLSQEHAGILILPESTPLGLQVRDVLGGEDHILDVEVTPNRPDVLSHFGLARELATLSKDMLKAPKVAKNPTKASRFPISIQEPKLCHRYLGRVFKNVKIAPSPDWMARRLTSCGIRSINNVVDITNYVLLELGHPLHAFDLDQLNGPSINIRRAHKGEKFLALDEKTYELVENDLVVADKDAVVAIAGVMGGQNSGVTPQTTRILLESAVFDRSSVRQTSRKLGLRSESSYRFERGTDAETALMAWNRASQLLMDLAGGEPAEFHDAYPTKLKFPTIQLNQNHLKTLLGMDVKESLVADILKRLNFSPKKNKSGWLCKVPAHRKDIFEEADLIEEIIRIVGYNAVPANISKFRVSAIDKSFKPAPIARLVQTLKGYGLSETLNSTFCPSEWPPLFSVDSADIVSLANPISQEESVLRPYLSINLLRSVIKNINHQQSGVGLFEIGKTYKPNEDSRLGFIISGEMAQKTWKTQASVVDIYYLKGLFSSLIQELSLDITLHEGSGKSFLHPGQSFEIRHHGVDVGWIGMVNPILAAELGLKEPCGLGEIHLSALTPERNIPSVSISKFPFVERDIAVVIDKRQVTWGRIQVEVEKTAGPLLKQIHPFDVYPLEESAGKPKNDSSASQLGEFEKSVAFRIRLQDENKTLSESDISNVVERVKSALQTNCGAKPR